MEPNLENKEGAMDLFMDLIKDLGAQENEIMQLLAKNMVTWWQYDEFQTSQVTVEIANIKAMT
jgi:hypothetical protein